MVRRLDDCSVWLPAVIEGGRKLSQYRTTCSSVDMPAEARTQSNTFFQPNILWLAGIKLSFAAVWWHNIVVHVNSSFYTNQETTIADRRFTALKLRPNVCLGCMNEKSRCRQTWCWICDEYAVEFPCWPRFRKPLDSCVMIAGKN